MCVRLLPGWGETEPEQDTSRPVHGSEEQQGKQGVEVVRVIVRAVQGVEGSPLRQFQQEPFARQEWQLCEGHHRPDGAREAEIERQKCVYVNR